MVPTGGKETRFAALRQNWTRPRPARPKQNCAGFPLPADNVGYSSPGKLEGMKRAKLCVGDDLLKVRNSQIGSYGSVPV